MADSAQGTSGRPVHKQGTGDTTRRDTAIDSRGTSGNVTYALDNVTAHVQRDAAPPRTQAAHPNMATSEAAPETHDANETNQAIGISECLACKQLTSPTCDQHTPPQSSEQLEESRLARETVEQISRYYPSDSTREEVWDAQLQEYQHPDQLPAVLPGQTAENARATTLPPIREVLPNIDWEAVRPAAVPAGHLRPVPDHWVAEDDLSQGHREAREEALRFERAVIELDSRVSRLQAQLRRSLYER
jgi:hypothetical protein